MDDTGHIFTGIPGVDSSQARRLTEAGFERWMLSLTWVEIQSDGEVPSTWPFSAWVLSLSDTEMKLVATLIADGWSNPNQLLDAVNVLRETASQHS